MPAPAWRKGRRLQGLPASIYRPGAHRGRAAAIDRPATAPKNRELAIGPFPMRSPQSMPAGASSAVRVSESRSGGCREQGPDVPARKQSWSVGKISCRRLDASLEYVERIEAARLAVGWKKDRISAALDRSDDHEIVRQMETLDAEFRMLRVELSAHAGFEIFAAVRITEDRLASSEEPADLDQRAGIGGCARERREVGNDDVALLHHRDVLFVNRPPGLLPRSDRFGIFVERRQTVQTPSPADLHLRCGMADPLGKKPVRPRHKAYPLHSPPLHARRTSPPPPPHLPP